MPTRHTVQQGETLAHIASDHGFADASKIRDDPANTDLGEHRPNDDVLHPGDEVVVPDREAKAEEVYVDGEHKFRLVRPPQRLALEVHSADGSPLDGWLYTLTIADMTHEGTVDGTIEHAVPLGVDEARLEVRENEAPSARVLTWDLRIGHLDPLDTVRGVQARLNNLGFGCGAIDGDHGERTAATIRAFRAAHNLPIDGALDDEMLAKLEEQYGC